MRAWPSLMLPEGLDPTQHIIATYWLRRPSGADIADALEALAATQSSGTWVELAGETATVRDRHAARIIGAWQVPDRETDAGDDPDTPDRVGSAAQGWVVRIAYPAHDIGRQIPLLLATTYGEGAALGPLRLLDLELPVSFTSGFAGPRFGIPGIRTLLGVADRPLLVCVMKPALGLSPEESGAVLRELALGGVDAVKDDELLVAHPWSSIEHRARSHARAATEAFEETGQRTLVFTNVTDRPDRMVANAHRAIDAGATGLMVDFVSVGISALGMLAEDPALTVPILGHLASSTAMTGSPTVGIASHLVLGKLPRLAGADLVVYPSPYGTLSSLRSKHLRLAAALTRPFHGLAPALPVPGGGLHPGLVPALAADLGTDFALGAGGAIHGHPLGARAGARAFRQAIDASVAGEPLQVAADRHPELAAALSAWADR